MDVVIKVKPTPRRRPRHDWVLELMVWRVGLIAHSSQSLDLLERELYMSV